MLSKYRDIEFLLQVGEYKAGSDAIADQAVSRHAHIIEFLKQAPELAISQDETYVLSVKAIGDDAVEMAAPAK